MDIGKRIKQLRIKNNLTLEDLASRCELTKGFLSQLERNLTSPSITTLEDITEVLGIKLADFFKEDNSDSEEKIVFGPNDYFVDEKDAMKITYLVPNSQKNMMEPILLVLQKDGVSNDIKPHDGEEFGYVLDGKVKIIDLSNDDEYLIRKGESFCLKGEFKHCIKNVAEKASKVIWVSSPSVF